MTGSSAYRFAFFDVDETLVQEKTMFTVLAELDRELGRPDADQVIASLRAMRQDGLDRRTVNQAFYEALRGLRRSDVRKVARSYVERRLRDGVDRPFLIEPAVAHLQALAQAGIRPVFVSGSAIDFLEALAEHLGVYAVLATDLELSDHGAYTGRIRGRSMIGAGKRAAVEQFLTDQGADAGECHGLGDHISDLEFLDLLGHPGILPGDAELEDVANRRGWFVLRMPAPFPTNPHVKVSIDA